MLLSSRHLRLLSSVLAVAGGAALFSAARIHAADEAKANPGRVAMIKHIMSGIHGPGSGALRELLKDEGPGDDKAWNEVATQAALLNESGHLLMQHGRCPDEVWSEATSKLRDGTAALYLAAGKKDLASAQEAMKVVSTSCQECHTKHKQAAPVAAPVAQAEAPAPAPAPAADAPAPAGTPASEPHARLAQIRHIMAGINGPTANSLNESLSTGPADDKGWLDVVRYAALINEVSFLLMENDRCPDEVWKNACSALREHSAKVAHAAETKNLEDARAGFKAMTGACGACHAVHKKPPA